MASSGDISNWIALARRDGGETLGRLLQKYSNYLRLMAMTQMDARLTARISPSDVVQETHCDAHRDFSKFRGHTEAEFIAWLRAILVHNLARLIERHVLAEKRDVRREVSLHQLGQSIERSTMRLQNFLAAREESPSSHAQRRERAVVLADHLSQLSPKYRDVLILRHLEGRSFAEVAERMGRSEGAVRMLWLRAIDRLRRILSDKGVP